MYSHLTRTNDIHDSIKHFYESWLILSHTGPSRDNLTAYESALQAQGAQNLWAFITQNSIVQNALQVRAVRQQQGLPYERVRQHQRHAAGLEENGPARRARPMATVQITNTTALVPAHPRASSGVSPTQLHSDPNPLAACFRAVQPDVGKISCSIVEPDSTSWSIKQKLSLKANKPLPFQPHFVPRNGEMVLFVLADDSCSIEYSAKFDKYVMFDNEANAETSHLEWLAGVVTEVPSFDLSTDDLTFNTRNGLDGSNSSFRIQLLVDNEGRGSEQQSCCVPLSLIRPLNGWKRWLHGISFEDVDQTVINALSLMRTVSITDRLQFIGMYPHARIYCGGVFIGAEYFVPGDTVRLHSSIDQSSPALDPNLDPNLDSANARISFTLSGESTVTDILIIKHIYVSFYNLDSNTSPPRLSVTLLGQVLTTSNQYDLPINLPTDASAFPYPFGSHSVTATSYNTTWYQANPFTRELEVPHNAVLGRLYEADAMGRLYGGEGVDPSQFLGYDFDGVKEARAMSGDGGEWKWGETRAGCLKLTEVDGIKLERETEGNVEGPREAERMIDPYEAYKRATFGGVDENTVQGAGSSGESRTNLGMAEGEDIGEEDAVWDGEIEVMEE